MKRPMGNTGWLYDLVYTARDPRVTGLGLVAVRDVVSFLRYAPAEGRGVANPLGGAIEAAYAFGISMIHAAEQLRLWSEPQ